MRVKIDAGQFAGFVGLDYQWIFYFPALVVVFRSSQSLYSGDVFGGIVYADVLDFDFGADCEENQSGLD